MNQKFLNNKGVSLIELIIVIAIMAVITGVGGYSYKMVSNKTVTQCAKNIQLSLEKDRVNAMGKKSASVTFYATDDGVYMTENINQGEDGATSVTTRIGKKGLTVNYGASGNTLDSSGITIQFSRSDGSLKSNYDDYFPIIVSKANKSYKIDIEPLTGRVTYGAN